MRATPITHAPLRAGRRQEITADADEEAEPEAATAFDPIRLAQARQQSAARQASAAEQAAEMAREAEAAARLAREEAELQARVLRAAARKSTQKFCLRRKYTPIFLACGAKKPPKFSPAAQIFPHQNPLYTSTGRRQPEPMPCTGGGRLSWRTVASGRGA